MFRIILRKVPLSSIPRFSFLKLWLTMNFPKWLIKKQASPIKKKNHPRPVYQKDGILFD